MSPKVFLGVLHTNSLEFSVQKTLHDSTMPEDCVDFMVPAPISSHLAVQLICARPRVITATNLPELAGTCVEHAHDVCITLAG